MHWFRHTTGTCARLVLAALVVVAQLGAITHALQHDIDAPQTQVCGTCITAHSTASGCITDAWCWQVEPDQTGAISYRAPAIASPKVPLARQRAPPVSL
jgi:hypothetical protein